MLTQTNRWDWRMRCIDGTMDNQTSCLNTKTTTLDLLLTTVETKAANVSPSQFLGPDLEEEATISVVLGIRLEEHRKNKIPPLRKGMPQRPLDGQGWKEKSSWWSDDQATDGESQSSQEKWVPTKSGHRDRTLYQREIKSHGKIVPKNARIEKEDLSTKTEVLKGQAKGNKRTNADLKESFEE